MKQKQSNVFALVCGTAPIAAALVYAVSDYGDKTFSMIAAVLAVLGGVLILAAQFKKLELVKLVGSLCVSGAVGLVAFKTIPTITDIFNGVVFIGGNQTAAVAFLIVFAVVGILDVICCFVSGQTEQ